MRQRIGGLFNPNPLNCRVLSRRKRQRKKNPIGHNNCWFVDLFDNVRCMLWVFRHLMRPSSSTTHWHRYHFKRIECRQYTYRESLEHFAILPPKPNFQAVRTRTRGNRALLSMASTTRFSTVCIAAPRHLSNKAKSIWWPQTRGIGLFSFDTSLSQLHKNRPSSILLVGRTNFN